MEFGTYNEHYLRKEIIKMNYEEYKRVIDQGMVEYVANGGSLFFMGGVTKEYIFAYDNEYDAADHKKILADKAAQAIYKKEKLPDGIRLKKCIFHGRNDKK